MTAIGIDLLMIWVASDIIYVSTSGMMMMIANMLIGWWLRMILWIEVDNRNCRWLAPRVARVIWFMFRWVDCWAARFCWLNLTIGIVDDCHTGQGGTLIPGCGVWYRHLRLITEACIPESPFLQPLHRTTVTRLMWKYYCKISWRTSCSWISVATFSSPNNMNMKFAKVARYVFTILQFK